MDRWTDGQTNIDRWIGRQFEELTHAVQRLTDGWTDRQTDWWMDGWIDSYYEELIHVVQRLRSPKMCGQQAGDVVPVLV